MIDPHWDLYWIAVIKSRLLGQSCLSTIFNVCVSRPITVVGFETVFLTLVDLVVTVTMAWPFLVLAMWPHGSPEDTIRGSLDGFVNPIDSAHKCVPNCELENILLSGWAVDASVGGGVPPVIVNITLDGAVITSVLANQSRPDLVPAGVAPDPNHGFTAKLPPEAVGKLRHGTHDISAIVHGHKLSPNSPSCSQVRCKSPKSENISYIDNGIIRVGIDLTRGGSIGYVASRFDCVSRVFLYLYEKHPYNIKI